MTNKEKQSIVEWLYLNDKDFDSVKAWRKEFIKMLDGLVVDKELKPFIQTSASDSLKELDKKFITVSHSDLEKQIKSCNFNWFNNNINFKNFEPINEKGEKEYKIFNFDKSILSEEVIEIMKKEGFIPGDIFDLLAFQKQEPKNKDFIVALGSVWRDSGGNRQVPYLGVGDGGRQLYLYFFGSDWAAHYRFFGVRK